MHQEEHLCSPSKLNSSNGKDRVPQMENSLTDSLSPLNSEKAVQEIIRQPLLSGVDDPLIEFSETLMNVAKALKRISEEKASAQAEAAEWKHKYESEKARNLHLEQKGGHCCKSKVESTRDLQDQVVLLDQNRKHCEFCSGRDDNGAQDVLQDYKPDSHLSSVRIKTVNKISLKWEYPPQAVLILTKPNSTSARNQCLEMVRWLKEEKELNIFVEPRVKADLLAESSFFSFIQTWENEKLSMHMKIDLIVTLGGDGTVLWAASLFKGSIPPIVPFSVGSLGFMTPFHSEHYRKDLDSILRGPFSIMLRHRLQCHIIRGRNESENEGPVLVLNEVTIDRGISSFLSNLECYCNMTFVTHVQGDGLILSTATGSTAYSLSAGGSMAHPEVPGILLTPICPHSLSFRPLILPENVIIRVVVPSSSRGHAWASFDGKGRRQLAPGDSLLCSMAPWPVPMACRIDSTDDFLRSIQDNLHWNLRRAQAADGPREQGPPEVG